LANVIQALAQLLGALLVFLWTLRKLRAQDTQWHLGAALHWHKNIGNDQVRLMTQ
jgi:hypothetical protein